MADPQEQFEHLIQHLRDISGHDFPINDNACTLIDESNEVAAVIELPEGSDLVMLHRMVSQLPADPDVRNGRALQLLTLNGSPDRLKGAWFSIDPEGHGIHLMTSSPIDGLTPAVFENLLLNYIQLANILTSELAEEELELSGQPPATGLQP